MRDPLNLVPNGDLLRAWKSIKIAHHRLARCLAFLHSFPICCSHRLLMLWPCSVQSHRHVLKVTKFWCCAKLGSWETGLRVRHMTRCGRCRDGLPFLAWSPMNFSIILQGGILDCHFVSEELATVFVEHEFPVLLPLEDPRASNAFRVTKAVLHGKCKASLLFAAINAAAYHQPLHFSMCAINLGQACHLQV